MYIDTHSRNAMEHTICNYFNIATEELLVLFVKAGKAAQREYYFHEDKFNNVINEFINLKIPKTPIDQILFFHLSRRLNSAQDNHTGNNLYNLLSTENAMTEFLKNHGVEFAPVGRRLELLYNEKIVSLMDLEREYIRYLRWRLGHDKKRIDLCFNGFLLKDLLYKNNYARGLSGAPELIGQLATFLKRRDIVTDYYKNSTYYCFEYCVPLDKVLFDDDEKLSNEDKQKYLLSKILYRLYNYTVTEIRYMFDNDNPVLRLADNDTMEEEYFVSSEEITQEMLSK